MAAKEKLSFLVERNNVCMNELTPKHRQRRRCGEGKATVSDYGQGRESEARGKGFETHKQEAIKNTLTHL